MNADQLYAEIIKRGPRSKPIDHMDFNPLTFLQDTMIRHPFVYNYSWAIPSREAIKEITAFIGSDKCLEVGAGNGLWAFLLKEAGVTIKATDSYTEHSTLNTEHECQMWRDMFDGKPSLSIGATGSHGACGSMPQGISKSPPRVDPQGTIKPVETQSDNILERMKLKREDFDLIKRQYVEVEKLDAEDASRKYSDHTCLMVCWGRCDPYSSFKGSKIVFIGEDDGCTTGPPSEEEWECVKTVPIPRWEGMKDFVGLYQRKI